MKNPVIRIGVWCWVLVSPPKGVVFFWVPVKTIHSWKNCFVENSWFFTIQFIYQRLNNKIAKWDVRGETINKHDLPTVIGVGMSLFSFDGSGRFQSGKLMRRPGCQRVRRRVVRNKIIKYFIQLTTPTGVQTLMSLRPCTWDRALEIMSLTNIDRVIDETFENIQKNSLKIK